MGHHSSKSGANLLVLKPIVAMVVVALTLFSAVPAVVVARRYGETQADYSAERDSPDNPPARISTPHLDSTTMNDAGSGRDAGADSETDVVLPAEGGGYTGHLGGEDEEDWYELAVGENRGYLVVMSPPEGANFDLGVVYPGGEQTSNQPAGESDGVFFVPSEPGSTEIKVIRVRGSGTYKLAVVVGSSQASENEDSAESGQTTEDQEDSTERGTILRHQGHLRQVPRTDRIELGFWAQYKYDEPRRLTVVGARVTVSVDVESDGVWDIENAPMIYSGQRDRWEYGVEVVKPGVNILYRVRAEAEGCEPQVGEGVIVDPPEEASPEEGTEGISGMDTTVANWVERGLDLGSGTIGNIIEKYESAISFMDNISPLRAWINYHNTDGQTGWTEFTGDEGDGDGVPEFKGIALVLPHGGRKPIDSIGAERVVYKYATPDVTKYDGITTDVYHYIFVYPYNDPVLDTTGAGGSKVYGAHDWDIEHVSVYIKNGDPLIGGEIIAVETGSHETILAYRPGALHFDQYGMLLVFSAKRSQATVCDTRDLFLLDAARSDYATVKGPGMVLAIDNQMSLPYLQTEVVPDPSPDPFAQYDEDGDGIFDISFFDKDDDGNLDKIPPENQKIKLPSQKEYVTAPKSVSHSSIYTNNERSLLGGALLQAVYMIDAAAEMVLPDTTDFQLGVEPHEHHFTLNLTGSYKITSWGIELKVSVPISLDENGRFFFPDNEVTPSFTFRFSKDTNKDGEHDTTVATIGGIIKLWGEVGVNVTIDTNTLQVKKVEVGSGWLKVDVVGAPGITEMENSDGETIASVTISDLRITWDGKIWGRVSAFSVRFRGWRVALSGITLDEGGLYIESATVRFKDMGVPQVGGNKYLQGTAYGLHIWPSGFSLEGVDIDLGNFTLAGYQLTRARAHFRYVNGGWRLGAEANMNITGWNVTVGFTIENTEPYLTEFHAGGSAPVAVGPLGPVPLFIANPGLYVQVEWVNNTWYVTVEISGDVSLATPNRPRGAAPLWVHGVLGVEVDATSGRLDEFYITGDVHVFTWTLAGGEVHFTQQNVWGSAWLNIANVITGDVDFKIYYGGFTSSDPNAQVMEANGNLKVFGYEVANGEVNFKRAHGNAKLNINLGPLWFEAKVKYAFPPVVSPDNAYFYGSVTAGFTWSFDWWVFHYDVNVSAGVELLLDKDGTRFSLGWVTLHWPQGAWWPEIIWGDAVEEPDPITDLTQMKVITEIPDNLPEPELEPLLGYTPPPPDFSISITPSALELYSGESVTVTVEVKPLNGLSSSVSMSASAPSGITASPSSWTASPSSWSESVTVGVTTEWGGDYKVTISGDCDGLVRSENLWVRVLDNDMGNENDAGDSEGAATSLTLTTDPGVPSVERVSGSGHLVAGDEDWYSFDIDTAKGKVIKVTMTQAEGSDFDLYLEYPDGRVESDTSDNRTKEIEVWIPAGGDTTGYKVRIVGSSDSDYQLTIQVKPQNDMNSGDDAGNSDSVATELSLGEDIRSYAIAGKGYLISPDSEDWYKFTTDGIKITVDMTQTSGTAFNVYLYSENIYTGELYLLIGEDSDSLQAKKIVAEADEKWYGTYYVQIITPGETDSYLLSIKVEKQNDMGLGHDAPDSLSDPPANIFTRLFVGAYENIYSYDGNSWSLAYGVDGAVQVFATYENKVYAGAWGKIYSFDGSKWDIAYDTGSPRVYSLAVYKDNLFAGTRGKIYTFDGSTWEEAHNTDSADEVVCSFAIYGGELYAGTYYIESMRSLIISRMSKGKIYSFDGNTWGVVHFTYGGINGTNSFATYSENLYVGTEAFIEFTDGTWTLEGVIYSFDGSTWEAVQRLMDNAVGSLAVYEGKLYAGTYGKDGDGGVYSFDGSTWEEAYVGKAVYSLYVYHTSSVSGSGWLVYPVDSEDYYSFDVTEGKLLAVSAAVPPHIYLLGPSINRTYGLSVLGDDENIVWRRTSRESGLGYVGMATGPSFGGYATGMYLLSIGLENQNDMSSGWDAGDTAIDATSLGGGKDRYIVGTGTSGLNEGETGFDFEWDYYCVTPQTNGYMKVVASLGKNFDSNIYYGSELKVKGASEPGWESVTAYYDLVPPNQLIITRQVTGGEEYYIGVFVGPDDPYLETTYQMEIYLDSAPPFIAITSPTAEETVPTTAKITVDASDANGIENVEFYVDGELEYAATASTPGRVLLSDNFDDGDYGGWTVVSGSWAVESGELSSSGSSDESIGVGDVNWGDVSIETSVKRISGADYAIDFRWDGGSNHYRMQTWDDYNTLRLYKMYSGGHKQLAWADLTGIDPTVWHAWKIEANGPNIRLYIDGVKYIDYTDISDPYLSGKIKFRVLNSDVHFDDVLVRANEYTYFWDTRRVSDNPADNPHTIKVKVHDKLGRASEGTVSVNVSNQPSIENLCHNLWTISVDAWDAGGIENVEFWIDGELRYADDAPPYSYTLPVGEHTVTVTAYDKAGNHISRSIEVPAYTWSVETVAPAMMWGGGVSMALDSSRNPHLVCMSRDGSVKYARWTGTGWEIETVDHKGRVSPGSLALDSSGNPHVAYIITRYSPRPGSRNCTLSHSILKYARWTGTGWEIKIVDNSGSETYALATQEGIDKSILMDKVSMALDGSGNPHIVYNIRQTTALTHNYSIKYARWTGTGWEIEYVKSRGWVPSGRSIALDSSGNPHIVYAEYNEYTYIGWDSTLNYAQRIEGTWKGEGIDNVPGPIWRAWMELDNFSKKPHIVYNVQYDRREDTLLKYARQNEGPEGNSSWEIETVDKGWMSSPSVALDNSGSPHITYWTWRQKWINRWPYITHTGTLKYAQSTKGSWDIETVDFIEVVDTAGLGSSPVIVLDNSGSPRIAYVATAGDLKYARRYMVKWNPAADVNGDGKVDILDVLIVAVAFGSYPGHESWNENADINGDNKVDLFDIRLLVEAFGSVMP